MPFSSPWSRGFFVFAAWLTVLVASQAAASNGTTGLRDDGTTAANAADIAVIDRALATAKPGDKFVHFGDVGITVANLQAFRARLAAEATGSQTTNGRPASAQGYGGQAEGTTGSQLPVPQADTPTGTAFKWPSGNVYYRFDPTQVSNSTITAAKMQQFRDGVGEWAAFANLHFIEFSGTPPNPNYVTVQESTTIGEGGFSSSVGMAGGEQFVQFSPTAWNRGTICHEVGHALGLYHEQQRDDRDTYVIINFGNMDPSQQGNFTKLPGGSVAQGPYDFYSVMHYARNALSNDGMDTISMQPGFTQFINIIGAVLDRTLSKLDRAGMATVYGNPSVAPSAVVTNTNDSGSGSMRAAIYYAFDQSPSSSPAPVTPTPTTVTFHIPNTDPNFSGGVYTIKPTNLMTSPGAGTTIDGTTQTAFGGDTNANGPEVALDGTAQAQYEFAGIFGPAFTLREANCAVKGFVIHSYDEQGILITSNSASGSVGTGNTVSGCYIGTDASGTTGIGNGSSWPGIEIMAGANHNTIGGTTAAARNVISGSTGYGVSIHDSGTNNNTVQGSYIGLNAGGTGALSNAFAGVVIQNGAQTNTVGGLTSGARNIISGNKTGGLVIRDSGTTGNMVQGNYIGVNATGTSPVANGVADQANDVFYSGVAIFLGAQNNIIGGSAAGVGNVISGNAGGGITVSDANTNGNTLQGNLIGTDPTGTAAIGNGFADPPNSFLYAGIAIFGGAQSTTIGGTATGAGNLISGNGAQGVYISDSGTALNTVQGNNIGLNVSGSAALGNGYAGVAIYTDGASNLIGGTTAAARNVISGNMNQGILIDGPGVSQNVVSGNFIGTDLTGLVARPNMFSGIGIYGTASSNTIGGATETARNVISGNTSDGVTIDGSGTVTNNVQGNFIGLGTNGTTALANGGNGVGVYDAAANNVIGGTTAGLRNFIAENGQAGILISGSGTGNLVQGNSIGLNLIGGAAGNSSYGVEMFGGAQLNTIGGSATGASNMISSNTSQGIAMFHSNPDPLTQQDTFSRNSIVANGTAGISLFDATNNSQPSPTITLAVLSTVGNPTGTDVSGSLTAAASTAYTIEFFASPSGAQGQFFIGLLGVMTNGAGTVSFTTSLGAAIPANYAITATATDPNGNTSQFSAVQTVTTTDSDGDGIPDNWTLKYFGHATGQAGDKSRAGDDADGTGMTNLQKFLAGLDPKNPNSVLRITSVSHTGSTIQMGFPSVAGKTYQFQYRDDLVAGNWSPLVDGIIGTGATLQITDPSANGLAKRFYRIALFP